MSEFNFIKASDKWVSVDKALPEPGYEYSPTVKTTGNMLLMTQYGGAYIGSMTYFIGDEYDPEEVTWYEKETEVQFDDVTHWMSIPDLPGQEAGNESA